jgi:hypothetical protein
MTQRKPTLSRIPLTSELLAALRKTLEHLDNLRMSDPNDKSVSDLKLSISDKIAEIEARP